MSRYSRRAVTGILLLATACTRTTVARLDPSLRLASTCEQAVIIYATPADAPAGYRELALLQSKGQALLTSDDRLRRDMRSKAASVGATGIIIRPTISPSATSSVLRTAASLPNPREAVALAITAPSDSARVKAACGATS